MGPAQAGLFFQGLVPLLHGSANQIRAAGALPGGGVALQSVVGGDSRAHLRPVPDPQFRRLLETLPAAAYTCDPQGRITYYNSHAVDLWGRRPRLNDADDRFCGSFKLFATDGSSIAHDECWMALALRNKTEYVGLEILIERPNGERLTALAHINPILDDAGVLLGAVNVVIDVTARRRAEDALKAADRAKDEFLATLAHELRNPLAPLRNAAQILQLDAPPSPNLRWALEVIDRQMQQMTRLIDDLLDVSRVTVNKLELRKSTVELGEIVQAAVESSHPLLESCGHTLRVTVEPRVFVDGDLTRLAQVVSNLLNNAAKYMERGGRVWLTAERQGGDAVISVRDAGIGLPADMLTRIFEIFVQVDRSLSRSRGGLGIGLTLVKKIVEMHDGTVTAFSDGAGRGSEFVVRLPARSADTTASGASGSSRPAAASARVLVVDDNEDSAASLAMLLEMVGHEVRTAHDGEEALAAAEDFRPDVAFLDIGLPRMNGHEVAERIRRQPWGKDMTLIALTGWGQDSDRLRSKEAGFDRHLVKPVDPTVLLELLGSNTREDLEEPSRGSGT